MTAVGEHHLSLRPDYDLERIRGFSDAVFAVAITFVAATFRLPGNTDLTNVRLAHYLGQQWPVYVSFLAGFVVVGYFWLSHHRLFELLVRANGRMVWLNFLLLFFVVLLPFPTEMLGQYRTLPEAYLVFNAVAFALGVVNVAMWGYAVGRHRLVSSQLDPRALRIYRLRSAWLPFVFGLSFLCSLGARGPGVAWLTVGCWALLPLGQPLIRLVVGPVPFAEVDAEATEVDDEDTGEIDVLAGPPPGVEGPVASSRPSARPDVAMLQRMFRSNESMGRLISFSDNVYAFAITLLGTRLVLPRPPTGDTSGLERAARDLGTSEFASFTLTFVVIALFWLVHHRVYLVIVRQNRTLRVLNLMHLMVIAVLPFSTDLLSTFDDDVLPFVVYAITVELASMMLAVMFTYAATRRRLIDPEVPDEEVRRSLVIAWVTPALFLLSIPLCFVSVWMAWVVWMVPVITLRFVRHHERDRVSGGP